MLVGLKFQNFEALIKGLTGFSTMQRLMAGVYNNHKNDVNNIKPLRTF